MRKIVGDLLNFLSRQSVINRQTIIFGILLLLGAVDYLTGFEISISFFYLFPVALAAWTLDRKTRYLFAGLSAFVWFLASFPDGETFSSTGVLIWNTVNLGGVFFATTYLVSALKKALEFERQMARTDLQTGALNRRSFIEVMNLELARIQRHGHPTTILYVGLVNMKSVKDMFGSNTGDEILERISRTLVQNLRIIDTVARLDEDVFVVLLPETAEVAAKVITPRLQWHLQTELENNQWPVSFSMGVVTYLDAPENIDEMIKLTDRLVLEAKQPGKDGIHYEIVKGTPGV